MHCAATRRVVYCRLFSFLPLHGKVQRLWGLRLCDLGGSCCFCVCVCVCRKVTFEVHVNLSTSKLKFFLILVVVALSLSLTQLSKVV